MALQLRIRTLNTVRLLPTALKHLTGIFAALVLLVIFTGLSYGLHYQAKAKAFWGRVDNTQDNDAWPFPLSFLMPVGGPAVNPQINQLCPASFLPLVPVRAAALSDDTYEALCGPEEDYRVQRFTLSEIGFNDPALVADFEAFFTTQ